jgi:hypothetical protein
MGSKALGYLPPFSSMEPEDRSEGGGADNLPSLHHFPGASILES